jgi:hypothetical protein
MTPDFLKLSLEDRKKFIPEWTELAGEYGLKLLFWGSTIGINEQVVFVFESNSRLEKFFIFQREWLQLGTPEAGKLIKYVRTITVH